MILTSLKSASLRLCLVVASVTVFGSALFAQTGAVVVSTNTTWATGTYNLTSLSVVNGAVLTVGGGSTVTVSGAVLVTANSNMVLQSVNNTAQVNGTWQGAGVTLNAGSVQVDPGSSINADGQGYVASAGPGGAPAGSSAGGSYGGLGGVGSGVSPLGTYGSSNAPTDLGSGGGSRCCGAVPGIGGGAIRLIVTGTLTDNGSISANGGNLVGYQGGGGSGGSVYVTTGGLVGSGVFTANGGTGGEAAGGGGRIVVSYNGSSSSFTGFAGSTTSGGSCGGQCSNGTSSAGGTGTAAFLDTSATNNNLNVYQNFFIPAGTTVSYNAITVQAGAILTIGGGSAVTVANAVTVSGTIVAQSINNSVQVNGAWAGVGVTLNAGSVQVNAGGSLNTDGQGYVANAGPGGAPAGSSAGGSYGGLGGTGNGTAAGPIYGSSTNPTDLGSGGSNRCCGNTPGSGGGALTLTVSGTLTDNGIISANGANVIGYQAGGGAGGSVLIHAGTLAGSGSIAANGGTGGEAAGGGGRVAVFYNVNSGFNPALVTANGGSTSVGNAGATGTVYTLAAGTNLTVSDNTVLPPNATLSYTSITVNNMATLTLGSGTSLTSGSITVSAGGTFAVGGGSTVTVSGAVLVTGNSNLILQSINNAVQVNGTWQGLGVTLTAGSVQVDPGSSINADGQGYLPNAGPGGAPSASSAGGSYGGVGGVGSGTAPGPTYGSPSAPTDLGSGGSVRCCNVIPGIGGGDVRLIVSGTVTNNGVISANGMNVGGLQGGAGSGGSVYVTTGGLVGSGIFSANGGVGGEAGAGGGRVAVYYNGSSSSFTGFATSTASGGGCGTQCSNGTSSAGANGTIAFFDTSVPNNNLSVYQNFTIPAGTTASYNAITAQGGAVLTIGGGSTITVANALTVSGTVVAQSANNAAQVNGAWQGSGVTINAASVQVSATGSINADNQGYVANAGPGGSPAGSSAGGSYGGLGGNGNGIAPSAIYGSSTAPTDLGSGGGSRCCGTTPGAGGGALFLNVSGTLTDNGIISSNGGNGVGLQVGGGSGGTLSIHTAALAGSGSLAANGGSGGEAGGGGGRLALYYATNSGFNLTLATANAGSSSSGNAGATGTVYSLGAGSNLTVSDNTVLPANANLTYTSIVVNNQGTLTLGSGTTVSANSITVSAGGTFAVGGGSTVTVNGAVLVTGNSNMIMQGVNNTGLVGGVWSGAGVTLIAGSVQVDPGSSINADSQGYVASAGPGGAPAGSSAGGSYGGLGGASNGTNPLAVYGSITNPIDLGSGGGSRCCGAVPGAGGGAMRLIVTGAITDNGTISANGGNVVGLQAGGGSGGSIFIVTGSLAGSGSIAANGGAGGEAAGGGGRIAVFYLTNGGFNTASIAAAGGQTGTVGAAGTVDAVNGPATVFLQPTASVIHGTSATVQWFTNIGGPSTLTLAGPQTATIATVTGSLLTTTFDTTQVPDGAYQLTLTVLNNAGQVAQQVVKDVVINNSVAWHSGTLTSSQTWGPPQVQALDGNVIIPSGVTLTILPGTVVKALAGAQITVQSGGTLIAIGTANAPVTFTTFDDYTIGGNTDFNQGVSVPSPGEWNGIGVLTGGTFNSNVNTIIRYVATVLSGSLGVNTTLYSTQVYTINGTLIVPAGVTLSIQPGSILKFGPGAGMNVQPGAALTANGTLAQPIYFTSINDISIGGDVNNTSGSVLPAPGDWNSIILDGATVSMQHVQMQYGGGPLNSGAQAGMIETTENANVTISDSVLANSFYIGIQTGYPNGGGDTVTVTDTVFYGIEDRAINAYGGSTVHVVNDTFDSNAAGVFSHGGTIDIENSIISNTLGTQFGGVEVCCGGVFSALTNNDVYTTSKGQGNYVSMSDPTGTLGNISANPVYMNATLHDYRPTYGSPVIDAASGLVGNYPLTDSFGLSRYNDPLVTTKTGKPDTNGNYPDMGAFEFVQTAPSNLDLTVSNVQGPSAALVGTQVQVTWTVTNIGSGTAYGPWHDAVYLVTNPGTNPVQGFAGMALEGVGAILGPGGSYNATATVTVPGTIVGSQRWEVKTNVLGEVFEGANTANNTGIALNPVNIDLNQLIPGAAPLAGSFAGPGQSAFYKVIPNATQTTKVQLALSAGVAGSVQIFVGADYVPSPQHFDFQQVEFNSTSASVVIPSGSTQTYYVTAYAQAIQTSPAAFSIQASNVQFSLTSVTPGNIVASGSATLTFTGGGFNNGTNFLLVDKNGKTYGSSATFLADSDHADVTFAVGSLPVGTYAAEAINGSTVTLANAVTLSANPNIFGQASSAVQVSLQTPQAFRAGFPSIVTLDYTNVSGDDIAAPIIYVSATNATLAEVPPPCTGCSANYPLQYGATFNSGLVLGINQQGPAGILPAGASGSIQFYATPTGLGSASFYLSTGSTDVIGTKLGLEYNICGTYQNQVVCQYLTYQSGGYTSAVNYCSSLTPAGASAGGFNRACMALLNNSGYTYTPTGNSVVGTGGQVSGTFLLDGTNVYAHVTLAGFNAMLAADATALSASGVYTYDVQKLLQYELQKDGLDQLNTRYHQGAFGFGPSHAFDITLNGSQITYPDGTVRNFPTPSPTQANTFLGLIGDYGTLTHQTDGSFLLTEPDGRLFHFAPSGNNFQFDYAQDRDGNRANITYTGTLVTKVADTFGDSIAFQYDSLGHIIQSTDQAGRSTTFQYDILNDALHSTFLTAISNATGTMNIKWNEGGSNGVGYIADSCITTYCGAAAIGVSNITYQDGTQENYSYDAIGRLTGQSAAGGTQALYYTYNSDGSLTTTDAYGKTLTAAPNASGLPLVIMDPLGNVGRLRYDSEDKIIGSLGSRGGSFSGNYDTLGNPAIATSALGSQTNLSWGASQSPTSLTDPDGDTMNFGFNANADLLSKTLANGLQATYTYNAQGQPITRTNRRGHTETMVWGAHGTLTSKTFANGTQNSYTYDGHDNILTVTTPAGTTRYTYDGADRVTSLTNPDGTGVTMTYNAGGQRIQMADSTGFITNYSYDAAGRVSQLTDGNGSSIVTYTYDANGRLVGKSLANGTSASYSYDPLGRPLSVVNYSPSKTILSQYDYTSDAGGNPVTMKAPNGNWSYAYDLDGQLTGVTTPSGSVQYTFDAAGNRTQVATNGAIATYSPNNLNEYQIANNVPYQYDADGNLISGNGWTYTYDDENHMLSMVNGSNSWSFQYDGLGNRVLGTHNGVTTRYLIDPQGYGNLVAELNGNGQATAHYVYGLDLTSTVQPSGTSYYNFDGTGNTVQLTNSSGAVVNSYSYLPFGEQTVLSATVSNPFTYAGEIGTRDEGSGLYFMRNRWYNPLLGRFQQPDPIGLAGGGNLYTYVQNSPLTAQDPLGLDPDYTGFTIGMILQAGVAVNNHNGDTFISVGVASGGGVSVVQGYTSLKHPADRGQAVSDEMGGFSVNGGAYTGVGGGITIPPSGNASLERGVGLGGKGGSINYAIKVPNDLAEPHRVFDDVNMFTGGLLYGTDPSSPLTNPGHPIFPHIPPPSCGGCITIPPHIIIIPVNASIDPNAKLTSGFGNSGFVPAGAPITYTITFENQPTATLPAQKVIVTDSLPSNLDWSTVQFNAISFNNVTLNAPTTGQTYTAQANVSTDANPVAVSAALNPATGVVTWTMQSVDPVTGGRPANPLAGFLPPNNAANAGTGYVTFSVMPKAGLTNGTTITNQASIVFDANAAIATNTVSNALDTSSVTSAINPLPATTTSTAFNVSWTGSDPSGSGIASYNIYVSIDGGPYSLWLSATTLTSSTYNAIAGHSFSFSSLATNNVGIVQTTPAAPQIVVVNFLTPTVAVTPAASTITSSQSLAVAIAVASPVSGTSVPSGTVTLSSGAYTSAAATLSSGAASITIPAGALINGIDTLTATYTPDSAASSFFGSATGTAQVVVGTAAPIVTLTPATLTFAATSGITSAAQTVQLSNTGNAPLSISGISLAGTGAGSFAQTNNCGTSLAAGANCTISVTFTPSSAASFSATLSIADNAGSPQTVSLTGTGTAVPTPVASVTPSSLTFTAASGTTSAAQTVTLSNTGNAALSISGVTLSGAGAGSFADTSACGSSLAAGANCLISVTFTPSSAASFSATLSIADNAASTPQTVTLTGTGTVAPVPVATLTPTSLTFTTTSGTTSAAQTAKLSNTGTAALNITGISLAGSGASSFAQTNTCGASLAAGSSCTISVTFTPGSVASFGATLSVADNATGSPQTVSLSGTGTAALTPIASLTPSALTFTTVAGSPSAAQTAVLSNTGNAALTISAITLTGTGAASFAQTNTCGTSVAAGSSCNISIIFTPSAAAAYSATLTIADNASGSPQTVSLTGTGTPIPAPIVSVTPATLTFTSTNGIASTAQTAQLSNTGNAPLTLTGITLTGAGATSFAQTNTCGTSLAPGSNCSISVIFTPTSVATFSASVSIADNATGSPQTVTLTGNGIAPPSFQLTATPATQSALAGSSVSYTINVNPQGGAFTSPVAFTVSGLPAGATATFTPTSVTPGSATASSTLTIQTSSLFGSLRPFDIGSSSRPILALIGFLFVVGRKRRRLALLSVFFVASLVGLASLTGCATAKKTVNYTITVTGTGASQVQTTSVVLTLHD